MNVSFIHRIPRFVGSRTVKNVLVFIANVISRSTVHSLRVDGMMLRLDTSCRMELNVVLDGGWDKKLKDHCKRYISGNGTSIDIGANIGLWTCFIAAQKAAGLVFAFEPSTRNYEMLMFHCAENALGKSVRAFKHGLSDTNSSLTLHKPSDFGSLTFVPACGDDTVDVTESIVQVVPLDSYIASFDGQVDFIKLDVEGFEYEVLRGATQTLQIFQPTVLFEVNGVYLRSRNLTLVDMFNLFPSSYSFYTLANDGTLHSVDVSMEINGYTLMDVIARGECMDSSGQNTD